MNDRPPDAAFHAVWLAISAGVILLACVLRVEGGERVILPLINRPLPETCWSRTWLQLPCPGCGLTRSFISLAHGDIGAAWNYNPAGPYLFFLILLQAPYRAWQLWRIARGMGEMHLGQLGFAAFWLVPVLLLTQWLERLRQHWF